MKDSKNTFLLVRNRSSLSDLPLYSSSISGLKWRSGDGTSWIFSDITGDAYVDHPSLELQSSAVSWRRKVSGLGFLAQPDYRSEDDFRRFGKPRLGFLLTAGNLDSMVSNYTVARKPPEKRMPIRSVEKEDGGRIGLRLCTQYVHEKLTKESPIILGGLEASLRRFAHYDYWDDRLRRSILLDAKADLLVYGMGEQAILEIAQRLGKKGPTADLRGIPGTVYAVSEMSPDFSGVHLPSYRELLSDSKVYGESFKIQYRNSEPLAGKPLVELYEEGSIRRYVYQEPPARPLSTEELDRFYSLPYTRNSHPAYTAAGGVPALQEVKFSLVSSPGCFGGCYFCALPSTRRRIVQSESHESSFGKPGQLIQSRTLKYTSMM